MRLASEIYTGPMVRAPSGAFSAAAAIANQRAWTAALFSPGAPFAVAPGAAMFCATELPQPIATAEARGTGCSWAGSLLLKKRDV